MDAIDIMVMSVIGSIAVPMSLILFRIALAAFGVWPLG
jgi:hypothetical protein